MRTGSRGAGIALGDGVDIEARPSEHAQVRMDGEAVRVESVELVLTQFDVTAEIDVSTDVPIGAGFGASGAMALGTALVLGCLDERARSRNELVSIAHAAEVTAGTGLGDVMAQAHGGVPIRIEPGAPEIGMLDDIPATGNIEYLTLGELSTEDVLAGETAPIDTAGGSALITLREYPTLEELVRTSRRFADESALLPDDVATIIEDVEDQGGHASMAMLGRTVFSLGSGLSDAGYDARSCEIDSCGARITADLGVY